MGKKILIIDDANTMRKIVGRSLRQAGLDFDEVFEAGDGQEALNLLATQKVDLILSDINMPNMDGITLIKELRALPAYNFIPILTLTTENSTEKKQQGKIAGATGWIVKPFDPDHLLSTVRRVL